MDDYFYSKIALSMLVAALVGFAMACWWCWKLYSSRSNRSEERNALICSNMEDQINQGTVRLQEMQTKLQETLAQTEAMEAKARAADARALGLEEGHRSEIEALRAQVSDTVSAVTRAEQAEAALERMRQQLDIEEAERRDADDRIRALQDQIEDHRQTLETWEGHIASVTREHESHVASLKAEIAGLQQSVADRSDAMSRLESDAALLSHVRQSMRERQTRIDGLRLQLAQANQAWQKSQAEVVNLKAFVAAGRDQQAKVRDAVITELVRELESAQASLSDRNETMGRLESDAALLSHVRQSMRERQTRIDGLSLQLKKARQEIADLRANLADRNEILGKLEADAALLSHVRQSMRQRQIRIDGLQLQLASAHKQLASRPPANGGPGRLAELEMTLSEKERQIQLLESNLVAASSEPRLEELAMSLAEKERQVQLLESNLVAASGVQLEFANLQQSHAESAVASELRIEELAMSLAEKERQIQLLESNLVAADSEQPIRELASSLEDKDRKIQMLESAAGELEKLRAELQTLRKSHAETAAAAELRIEELAMAVAEKERQIQLLESNLITADAAGGADSDEEIPRLQAELADREERLAAWEIRYEAALGDLYGEAGRLNARIRELESGPVTQARSDVQTRLRLASLQGIQFLPDSAEILPESLAVLQHAVDALMYWREGEIEIAGHTDSWGEESNNMDLSRRRAEAVRDYLVHNGIPQHLLKATGYGGTRPIAANTTPDGRFANRRIEFVVREHA